MYQITINGMKVAEVSGAEAAWEYFKMACELANTIGGKVDLVEVIAHHFTCEVVD